MSDTSSPRPPPLVIEAGRTERHYWRDLWRYRELLGFLAWRDIKVRYKQAVLGVAWAVVQPAIQTVLLTFVFHKLARMPAGDFSDSQYPLLVLTGLLPWQLFSGAFSGAGSSLVNNAHLISKVYFPRLIVPLSAVVVALIDMVVLLLIALPYAMAEGIYPSWHLLFLPVFIFGAMIVALGAGLWITALTVKYRDFRFISPFLLQIGVFVTPIGFRTDVLPRWRDLLALNPLTSMVEGFRWCLLGGRTEFYDRGLLFAIAVTTLMLLTGLWYFRKTERQFADVI